ncbi:jacalin-like lectin [Paenibacillus aurantiacus]|uniref:Jacalin-like lectin n=1 Tax=Paenibacillus aurantiacus TaxID=1936118 RepID=A0ABV5KPU7_9BACL
MSEWLAPDFDCVVMTDSSGKMFSYGDRLTVVDKASYGLTEVVAVRKQGENYVLGMGIYFLAAGAHNRIVLVPEERQATPFRIQPGGERTWTIQAAGTSAFMAPGDDGEIFLKDAGAPPAYRFESVLDALRHMTFGCECHHHDGPSPRDLKWDDKGHRFVVGTAVELIRSRSEELPYAGLFLRFWDNKEFRDALYQGLHDCDYKQPYVGTMMFMGFWQESYDSHFYDPDTKQSYNKGALFGGRSKENALERCLHYRGKHLALAAEVKKLLLQGHGFRRGHLAEIGYSLGLALHYLSDLSQPMHAANFTNVFGEDQDHPIPIVTVRDRRHSNFEHYFDAHYPAYSHFAEDARTIRLNQGAKVTPEAIIHGLARHSKDVYKQKLEPIIRNMEDDEAFGPEVDETLYACIPAGIEAVASFLVDWTADFGEGSRTTLDMIYRQLLFRPASEQEYERDRASLLDGTRTVKDVVYQTAISPDYRFHGVTGRSFEEALERLLTILLHRSLREGDRERFYVEHVERDWELVVRKVMDSAEYTDRYGTRHFPCPDIAKFPRTRGFGGTEGTFFADNVYTARRIAALTIRAGHVIHSIAAEYEEADGRVAKQETHGGASGTPHRIEFEPGEHITRITGYGGTVSARPERRMVVRQLTIRTNRRTYGPFGGPGEGYSFRIDSDSVLGLFGQASKDALDQLGLFVAVPESTTEWIRGPVYGLDEGIAFSDPIAESRRLAGFAVRHGVYKPLKGNKKFVFDIVGLLRSENGSGMQRMWRQAKAGVVESFGFDEDEYIVRITGRSGNWIDQLTIHTNKRAYGPFGGDGGSPFAYECAEDVEGFYGKQYSGSQDVPMLQFGLILKQTGGQSGS